VSAPKEETKAAGGDAAKAAKPADDKAAKAPTKK